MKKFLKLTFVFVCFLLMSFKCSSYEDLNRRDFSVKNNSEETIYVTEATYAKKGEFLTYGYVRNCTAWTLKCVSPGEQYDGRCAIPSDAFPYRELQVLILKESTLRDCSERDLIENDVHDKRYVLTYEELEALNFIIDYKGE